MHPAQPVDLLHSPKNCISQILVLVLKNRSNEIRSNEIRISQELPVHLLFFCSKDSLTIYKGGVKDPNEIISGPLCGDFPNPSQFVSEGNEIFLEFPADSYTTDRGFRIKYDVSGKP